MSVSSIVTLSDIPSPCLVLSDMGFTRLSCHYIPISSHVDGWVVQYILYCTDSLAQRLSKRGHRMVTFARKQKFLAPGFFPSSDEGLHKRHNLGIFAYEYENPSFFQGSWPWERGTSPAPRDNQPARRYCCLFKSAGPFAYIVIDLQDRDIRTRLARTHFTNPCLLYDLEFHHVRGSPSIVDILITLRKTLIYTDLSFQSADQIRMAFTVYASVSTTLPCIR